VIDRELVPILILEEEDRIEHTKAVARACGMKI
jgi:hypothetical protein